MTIEELKARMNENSDKLGVLVTSYNDAVTAEQSTAKIDADINEIIASYAADAWSVLVQELKAEAEGPMLAAIRKLTYTVICVKDEKVEGSDAKIRVTATKEKEIDLAKLDSQLGGIGVEDNWYHLIQRVNNLLTVKTAERLGVKDLKTIRDTYAMSDIARDINLGKDPCSNTQLLKTLKKVVSAMIGEDFSKKALSHDVNYLLYVYAKKGKKALTVSCANHRNFTSYIMMICHRIVTDGKYDVEYRVKKN